MTPADARRTVVHDPQVPQLDCPAHASLEPATGDDEPGPEPRPQVDERDAAQATAEPRPRLRQGHRSDVVLDDDRQAQLLLEQVGGRDVTPVEVHRHQQPAASVVDGAGDRYTDS